MQVRCDDCTWGYHQHCINKNGGEKAIHINLKDIKHFTGPCCSDKGDYIVYQ